MSNWIDVIARYVTQREALAEAILVEALRSPEVRRRLQRAVGIDLRWNITSVTSQEWSVSREARHDIVLTSSAGRQVRLELKGDAPFTKRQTRALKKGSSANDNTRIDVLIIPSWREEPKNLGPGINVINWEDIDRALGPKKPGSLANLWLGDVRVDPSRLILDAKQYIKYWETKEDNLSWRNLWQSLQFIRSQFARRLEFSKIDGSKKRGELWYYGVMVTFGSKDFWLGWVFRREKHGQFHLSLIALENSKGLHLKGAELQSLAGLSHNTERLVKLWDAQSDTGILDLHKLCDRLRRVCRIRSL
jgi:hypothetical protein